MINTVQLIILVVALFAVFLLNKLYRNSGKVATPDIPDAKTIKRVLAESVSFYQQLAPAEQLRFEERVAYFLNHIRITPIQDAAVQPEDRVFVAAAGVIPLFRFKNWFYNNLNEVLIYPDTFSKDFELKGESRNVAGMVGDGFMHRTMILSLQYLRAGFLQHTKGNTAIHEFVHLVDKSDGAVDGIPENLLDQSYLKAWVSLVHEYIKEIRAYEITDINPYGATNTEEFFAVVSEYFFQEPELLEANHPDLYRMLEKAFRSQE
ncbi:MAG: peptidase [Sphingobacteriales bacterium]|nr:MAG: peptidase [Sphingobacteriales bacterium]